MKKYFSNIKVVLIALIVLIILVSGAVAGVFLLRESQDIRQQADTGGGIVDILITTDTSLNPGQSVTLKLKAEHFNQSALNGLQVVADFTFTGTVPSDLSFNQATIPGLQTAGTTTTAITNGKRLIVGFITSSPTEPVTLEGNYELGTITFTVPTTGQINIVFNNQLTKVIQNNTGTNIANSLSAQNLSIAQVQDDNSDDENAPPLDDTTDDLDRALEQRDTNNDESLAATTPTPTPLRTGVGGTGTGRTSRTSTASGILAQTQIDQPELPESLPESGFNLSGILTVIGSILLVSGGGLWLFFHKHSTE